MSEFNALTFTYDDIPSEKFGLYIYDSDGGDIYQVNENYSINTFVSSATQERVFLGYNNVDALQFELTIASDMPVNAYLRRKINQWLIGRNGYKKLRIIRPDYYDLYFNCVFVKQETIYIGGLVYAFKITAVCDSPYQYGSNIITHYTVDSNGVLSLNNKSDVDYVFPVITITMSPDGGDLSITNTSDNSREFKFTGLSGGEVITVDNKNKIITSSLGLFRLSAFNKKWLRFVGGINNLDITGAASIQIVTPVIKRVGV